jgi:peptidoglycan/xylan/chitin deacetylase (PgdA/CDA1 family)
MKNPRTNKLLYLLTAITFFITFTACAKRMNTSNSNSQANSSQYLASNSPSINQTSANVEQNQKQSPAEPEFSTEKDDYFNAMIEAKKRKKVSLSRNVDPGSIKVPVLMYHSINPKSTNNLIITPKEFEKQIGWLKDNGFTPLFLDELYSILTTGRNVPPKPIALTFDDGYEDNYTEAYPILKKHNFKATIFLITSSIGHASSLKEHEIREMHANNIDFQSHTASHLELNSLSYKKQLEELINSRDAINKLLNKNTDYLCYPVGKYNENTIKALKDAGYKMAFTTKPGHAKLSNGLYMIRRVRMMPGMNMQVLNNKG